MPSTELQLQHTAYSWEQTNWIAGHPVPIVGANGNWQVPDIATMTYQDTGRPVTGYSPYIGLNGNWWVWDTTEEEYVDSGVTAATGLVDGSVTTAKLAAGAVTPAKLSDETKVALGVRTASITLTVAGWTAVSGTDNYKQPVTISGATITNYTKVDLQPNATVLQQLIDDGVVALFVTNNQTVLTATAMGAAPTAALTIQVTLTETEEVASS